MIGLNEELAAREATGHPVKIGLIGAGQMGVDVVAQVKMMQGIDVVAVDLASDADAAVMAASASTPTTLVWSPG